MLRALLVLAVVSSCAPSAPLLPSSEAPKSALDAHGARLEARPNDAGDSDGAEPDARPRSRASRLAPPFGNASGIRRVAPPSDAAPASTPEIVASAAERD